MTGRVCDSDFHALCGADPQDFTFPLKRDADGDHLYLSCRAERRAILVIETEYIVTETWEQKGSYRNGYLLNFALSVRDSFIAEPDGYSRGSDRSWKISIPAATEERDERAASGCTDGKILRSSL